MKNSFLILGLATLGFAGCKKEKLDLTTTLVQPNITTPKLSTVDSALLKSRDLYLWYNQIPSGFSTATYTDPSFLMKAIRDYSIEPGFTAPVDKWSFAMKKNEWDKLSEGINANFNSTSEVSGDFGLSVFFRAEGDLRVRMVEPESPGGRLGIRRGWRVKAINGNTSMVTSNASFIINSIYESGAVTIQFEKPDGTLQDISLNAASYNTHPVYLDTIYTSQNHKTGYFVFTSFLGKVAETKAELQRVFSKFASQGVTDVIIDLRYNGGGYVSLQEEVANYLAPASATGSLMMKQQFNDKNTQFNSTTNFQKKGGLNINAIKFIVSQGTASASELLINNLRPYMDVKLIGPTATHGKPVGYFPVPVGDWYVFPVSFKTTNKNGEGNYFSGLTVNSAVADGLDKDWGDITESCLAKALQYINTGTFTKQKETTVAVQDAKITAGNELLDQHNFKGTIQK